MGHCIISKELLNNGLQTVGQRQKGRKEGINNASEFRGETIRTTVGQSVNEECNKNLISAFTDQKHQKSEEPISCSSDPALNFWKYYYVTQERKYKKMSFMFNSVKLRLLN